MNHFQKVCEYGNVHAQCRCPGPKSTIYVVCDIEAHRTKLDAGKAHELIFLIRDILDKIAIEEGGNSNYTYIQVLKARSLLDELTKTLDSAKHI